METTLCDVTDDLSCFTILPTKELNRKKLGLKLVSDTKSVSESDPPLPYYSNPSDKEPVSPDSGFSSDESGSPIVHRDQRSRTLPSALRGSQKKVSAKRVRFADALGLNLEIRQYFTEKETFQFSNQPPSPTPEHRLVLSNFTYRSEFEYNQRACEEKVCLAKVCAHNRSIIGQINVANVSFTKEVLVRYTVSNWEVFDEVPASYGHSVYGANDVDAFVFSITLPVDMKHGQCQFCIRFTVNGCEFWDNNQGANYQVDVMPIVSFPEVARDSAGMSAPRTNSFFTPRRLRRWRRAQEEFDDESSHIYIPRRHGAP